MKPLAYPNVGTMLDRTTRLLKQHYLRAFREEGIDLSTEQWVLLDRLFTQGDASQTELANGTYKDAPTVSRIIDKLARKKLVERRRYPNDRRRYLVSITPTGRKVHERITPYVQDLRQQTWQGLSEDDFLRLQDILRHIRDNFEEE
ncbi:DNA-binding MarR family transcriptional regulator [Lewinella marina]|uniref:MarR family transcriptional regulator n=1 Tax=Neolewinella marina TaxID=438751 RepID=A0A2G0CH47_9BACT|nr:MarR family transcriptional regulator [Neolewinella marina]NJB86231.1 DNA-binding MarR family transcriptional regulator [Neolewinella marina]PHK99296.1 MarR family transcriptional regulator [Neolewinella marina]